MHVEIRILDPGEAYVRTHVAAEVFDDEPDPRLTEEFLADPRHHLAVAIERNLVVGFASALPRGVGSTILRALFRHAERIGCREAWVLTTRSNAAAIRLYQSMGGSEAGDDPPVMFSFPLRANGAGR